MTTEPQSAEPQMPASLLLAQLSLPAGTSVTLLCPIMTSPDRALALDLTPELLARLTRAALAAELGAEVRGEPLFELSLQDVPVRALTPHVPAGTPVQALQEGELPDRLVLAPLSALGQPEEAAPARLCVTTQDLTLITRKPSDECSECSEPLPFHQLAHSLTRLLQLIRPAPLLSPHQQEVLDVGAVALARLHPAPHFSAAALLHGTDWLAIAVGREALTQLADATEEEARNMEHHGDLSELVRENRHTVQVIEALNAALGRLQQLASGGPLPVFVATPAHAPLGEPQPGVQLSVQFPDPLGGEEVLLRNAYFSLHGAQEAVRTLPGHTPVPGGLLRDCAWEHAGKIRVLRSPGGQIVATITPVTLPGTSDAAQ